MGAGERRVHQEILHVSGAHILANSLEALHRMVPWSLSANSLQSPRLERENIVQHARIYAAIESGDEEATRPAMRRHVLDSDEVSAGWFEREQAGPRARNGVRPKPLTAVRGRAPRRR